MPDSLRVSRVRLKASNPESVRTGLIGHISFIVNDSLAVDGVALRRTLDGRITLSFPARLDSKGRRHFSVRPLDDHVRQAIESQVLAALGIKAEEAAT